MRKRLSLLALALCSAMPGAYAAPKAASPKRTVNRVLTGASAQQLSAALNLPALGNEDAAGKIFEGTQNLVAISCRQNASQSTACSVSIEGEEMEDASEMLFFGKDANALFGALNVTAFYGRTGDAKIFTDSEEAVKILCARSLIPNGDRFACSIDLPNR